MTISASVGDVFIRNGARLPNWLELASEDYPHWRKLQVSSDKVEAMARRAGWYFSFLAPELQGAAYGASRESAIRKALNRVLEKVGTPSFNALEVTGIVAHRLLGLYHAHVETHARHLHPTPFLRDPDPYYYPSGVWNFTPIAWKAAEGAPEDKGV